MTVILFAGSTYYPGGGSSDEVGRYDTLEEAKAALSECLYDDWAEALDMDSGDWVLLDPWEYQND